MSIRPKSAVLVAGLLMAAGLLATCGCGTEPLPAPSPAAKKSSPTSSPQDATAKARAADEAARIVKVEFPDGDPSVSAELGGPGFSGQGWETAQPGALGDPRAKPGGSMVTNLNSWPENLRVYGPGSNWYTNQVIVGLCYETLCRSHPETLDTLPSLASHWQVLDDHMKFRFRINPRAHWSDGKPVVAQDVVATYRLLMDKSLIDPGNKAAIESMKEPKALSKYLVEVECQYKHWRNFRSFTSMTILPAHEIGGLKGSAYRENYNFKYTVTSGPYIVYPSDIRSPESLTLTRRKSYWGNDLEMNRGLFNFDSIRYIVIENDRLAFDKTLKGELDFYPVYTAKWWKEDVVGLDGVSPSENVRQGYLIAQKVFTRSPEGIQGLVFNMRRPPLDDVRVRKALAHLYDRKTLVAKFAYGEYTPLKSYYPGGDFENSDNELVEYNPKLAMKLLTEAGFTERDSDGVLQRNGERLSLTIVYRTEGFEKYYTAYQEACRRVGVEIKLDLTDNAALSKILEERTFKAASSALTGTLFPDPRAHWQSKMADENTSVNYSGFKSKEADEIIARYDKSFDFKERAALMRQLDGILFKAHPYMLDWYIPCQRMLWWNKFGMPKTVLTKYGDWADVYSTWWYDPDKEEQLKAVRRSGQALPTPPPELHPWPRGAAERPATDG